MEVYDFVAAAAERDTDTNDENNTDDNDFGFDDADDADTLVIDKLVSVLQERRKFPSRQRDRKIAELSITFLRDATDADDTDNEDDAATDDDEDDYDDDTLVINKLISVLQPERQRNRKIVELSNTFLDNLEEDVHDMMKVQPEGEDEYDGLDDTRDTKEEVETAIRFCPGVLSRRGGINKLYPIQSIMYIVMIDDAKAVSFVNVLAQLAIEFQSFQDNERGGILTEDRYGRNMLHYLVSSSNPKYYDDDHHRLVDNRFLEEFFRLRRMNLIEKEDIRRYNLVHHVCWMKIFAPKRFQFLIDWDPTSLLHLHENNGFTPLHQAAQHKKSIEQFRTVFDAGLRYFLNKLGIGLAFRRDNRGITAFRFACKVHSTSKVMETLESTLAKYASTTPLNVANALIIAARNDNIHLDCVHFLMTRHPVFVVNLLRFGPNITNNNSNSDVIIRDDTNHLQDYNNEENHDIDANSTTSENGGNGEHCETRDNTIKAQGKNRKRKRE